MTSYTANKGQADKSLWYCVLREHMNENSQPDSMDDLYSTRSYARQWDWREIRFL